MPVVAVVLAAGFGTRFDENNPKQLVSVGGKPIVCWSIEAFERNDRVSDIIVVVNERVSRDGERCSSTKPATPRCGPSIPGGAERVDSTLAPRLDLLKQAGIPAGAKILIHDGVRPFVEERSIDGCIDSLDQFNAATVAYASTDTILLDRRSGRAQGGAHPCRIVRTPSARKPRRPSVSVPSSKPTNWPPPTPTSTRPTTRAWWWTTCPNEPVAIVDGSETNLKITTPVRHADRRRHRPQPRPRTRQGGSQGAHARRVRRSVLPDAQPLIFIER